jgi:hypothetical protein
MTRPKTKAFWRSVEEQQADQDLEEILAMSDEEIDRELIAMGSDPKAIRAKGAAMARAASERNARYALHHAMRNRVEGLAQGATSTPRPPRAELLARIKVAAGNPKFARPAAAMFRKKSAEDCTDEELAMLLEQLELLAKLV